MTVHVRSARIETREELQEGRRGSGALGLQYLWTLYTVESSAFVYGLESEDARKPEVGKDYEVKQITKDRMILLIPGKKQASEVRFFIKSVSEKQKQ